MKKSAFGKTAIWSLSVLMAGMLCLGCSKSTPAPSHTPTAAGTFTGQDLPAEVEELDGTPLYSVSAEIAKLHDFDGAAFLLIAPQDPTKALLVMEPGATPDSLGERESKPVKLSGVKELIDSEKLISHVKDNYELALQTDPSGKVVVLKVQAKDSAPEASATPAGSESDAASE